MFKPIPLHYKIIRLISNNPFPNRNTNINPYSITGAKLFFKRYKSLILNKLYYKDLIELHGDVDLFIKAEKASATRYICIEASLTKKGIKYFELNIKKEKENLPAVYSNHTPTNTKTPTKSPLRIVR